MEGITGALAKGKIYKPTLSGCLIYLHTTDIAATLALVTANGGRVLLLKSAASQTGYVAVKFAPVGSGASRGDC